MMFVMLLKVYIHTGHAWEMCLTTVGIEPTTFGILAQCSAKTNLEKLGSYMRGFTVFEQASGRDFGVKG